MCVPFKPAIEKNCQIEKRFRSSLNLSYKGDMGIPWLQPLQPRFHQGAGQGTFRGCDIDLPVFFGETSGDRNRLWGDNCNGLRSWFCHVLPTSSGNLFVGKSPNLGICFFRICVVPASKIPFKMQTMQMTVKICLKWGSFSKRESSQCTWLRITWS